MNNLSYDLYLADVLALAATIVIKSEESVNAINNNIALMYGQSAVGNTPSEWKYYRNICGLLHATDEPIYITSVDDESVIEFSIDTLSVHKNTRKAYAYGSRYYKELVEKNSLMEQYIRGVLYPANMTTAITSPNGKIISYPDNLVEPTEFTLITKLQQYVDGTNNRWHSKAYGIYHELYNAAQHGIMYVCTLPLAILNIRNSLRFTHEAHSYHIKAFLIGRGINPLYLTALNREQLVYLYKNIRYFQQNVGQQKIQDALIDILLTKRNLPIEKITFKHDITNLGNKTNTTFLPSVSLVKTKLNDVISMDVGGNESFSDLVRRQITYLSGNKNYYDEFAIRDEELLKRSVSNVLQTKVLQSNAIDLTDATIVKRHDVLLANWCSLAFNGNYRSTITVKNPRSGNPITLSVKDAFIYLNILSLKYLSPIVPSLATDALDDTNETPIDVDNLTLNKLRLVSKRVRKSGNISFFDIRDAVPSYVITDNEIYQWLSIEPLYDTNSFRIISTEDFYLHCNELFNAGQYEWSLMGNKHNFITRLDLQKVISSIYTNRYYTNNDYLKDPNGDFYKVTDWLQFKQLPEIDFTTDELITLSGDLFLAGTGSDIFNHLSMAEIQNAMIGILRDLSSYTVQYLSSINTSPIQVVEKYPNGLNNVNSTGSTKADQYYVKYDIYSKQSHVATLPDFLLMRKMILKSSLNSNKTTGIVKMILNAPSGGFNPTINDIQVGVELFTPFITNIDTLSKEEKWTMYYAYLGLNDNGIGDLSSILPNNILPLFIYEPVGADIDAFHALPSVINFPIPILFIDTTDTSMVINVNAIKEFLLNPAVDVLDIFRL